MEGKNNLDGILSEDTRVLAERSQSVSSKLDRLEVAFETKMDRLQVALTEMFAGFENILSDQLDKLRDLEEVLKDIKELLQES